MPNSKIFLHKSKKFGVPEQFDGMEARLHACSARMQSIPPQSGVMPCVLRGYRREETLALRARLRGLQAGMGVRCGGRVRPAAAPLFIILLASVSEPVEIFDRFLFFRYLRCGTTLQNVHIYS